MRKDKEDRDKIREENQKMRYLRFLVDLTVSLLYQDNTSIVEAIELMKDTKKRVLTLFPDKENTYDLIYKPRFARIIMEKLELN